MREMLGGLRNILTTVFLSAFAGYLVSPVMTDITVSAVCSDLNDSCSTTRKQRGWYQTHPTSLAFASSLRLHSWHRPMFWNSPSMSALIPNIVIVSGHASCCSLAVYLTGLQQVRYYRDTYFFYTFYVVKTLFDLICQGTVDCLAQAHVAKNIHGSKRMSKFGV
ncbi:unnamed protein product [Brassica oleracea var. botrytis]|uniref:Uncharacterized protein n=2 Tax=Brassica oleracea TaxID=3712 RepID=A0A0D3BE42_BRAOL|nr:unnamed protein product [Brassica oleracea]